MKKTHSLDQFFKLTHHIVVHHTYVGAARYSAIGNYSPA